MKVIINACFSADMWNLKTSTAYQYESRYEGWSACQSHVELGSQGVEKHAYYRENTKKQDGTEVSSS